MLIVAATYRGTNCLRRHLLQIIVDFTILCRVLRGETMPVTTIRSLADEIGVSYWQIRHVLRRGYVQVTRPFQQRKLYLSPAEVKAIIAFFGAVEGNEDRQHS